MTTAADSSDRVPRIRLPRERRGQQLLDVAERLFADHGFNDTSMEEVARAAGVTRTVVYGHYATKDAIFIACLRRARADLEHRLSELIQANGQMFMGEAFERVIEVFFQILEQDPGRWAMLYSTGPGLSEDVVNHVTTLRFDTVNGIADVIGHCVTEMEPDRINAYAHAVSGVTEQLGNWWLANPAASRGRVVALCRDFIMDGFSPWTDSRRGHESPSEPHSAASTHIAFSNAAGEPGPGRAVDRVGEL
ncbi:TetR/AcrR family transcriptional regulator [Pseudarthrobacter sp. SSS035]|uniref:TetR/AcrR family transcriptional regulator n=1 Tax=Pseudarthrobacter sp. SSS035 TaxID=2931399 RepID=UPI00200E3706|nr:TetR/AcrR family transcriptional regulator [Pseudarthrobacter sp. SSS035]